MWKRLHSYNRLTFPQIVFCRIDTIKMIYYDMLYSIFIFGAMHLNVSKEKYKLRCIKIL